MKDNTAANHFQNALAGGFSDAFLTVFSVGNLTNNKEQLLVEEGGFSIFPNPANNSLNLEFSDRIIGNVQMEIFDILGKRVFVSKEDLDLNKFLNINTSDFIDGSYFVALNFDGNRIVKKFIVHRY